MPLKHALIGVSLMTVTSSLFAENVPVDPRLVAALKQSVQQIHSFSDELDALIWLTDMSKRLRHRIPDPFYRVNLLKTVHGEATRANLEPELVLALIQVESNFDRFAVSRSGAHGLMQIMPFWKNEIGQPKDNLFHPRTNLRYGCSILRYYLDRAKGKLSPALARYNGSFGRDEYPRKVLLAFNGTWRSN